MTDIKYYINGRATKHHIDTDIRWECGSGNCQAPKAVAKKCSFYKVNRCKEHIRSHCCKHVIEADDIEKETFIDVYNKTNKEHIGNISDLVMNDRILGKYEKLSKDVINNTSIGYRSPMNQNIVVSGNEEFYRYSTYIREYEDKSQKIVSSYPSYISDRFWAFPYIKDQIIDKCSDYLNQKLEFIKNNANPNFYDRLRICLALHQSILNNDTDRNDVDKKIQGFLLVYCLNGENFKRVEKFYKELFKKDNKLNLKNEFINKTEEFIYKQLNFKRTYDEYKNQYRYIDTFKEYNVQETSYNRELYSEQILALYVLHCYEELIDKNTSFDKKLPAKREVLYANANGLDNKNEYLLEMPIIISFIKKILRDLLKDNDYYDFGAFQMVDDMFMLNISIKILILYKKKTDYYIEGFDKGLGLIKTEYLYHLSRYLDAFKSNDIRWWHELYSKIFKIDINNADFLTLQSVPDI